MTPGRLLLIESLRYTPSPSALGIITDYCIKFGKFKHGLCPVGGDRVPFLLCTPWLPPPCQVFESTSLLCSCARTSCVFKSRSEDAEYSILAEITDACFRQVAVVVHQSLVLDPASVSSTGRSGAWGCSSGARSDLWSGWSKSETRGCQPAVGEEAQRAHQLSLYS